MKRNENENKSEKFLPSNNIFICYFFLLASVILIIQLTAILYSTLVVNLIK